MAGQDSSKVWGATELSKMMQDFYGPENIPMVEEIEKRQTSKLWKVWYLFFYMIWKRLLLQDKLQAIHTEAL